MFNIPIPAETSSESFLNLWHDLKEWRFNANFDVFLSEVRQRHHPANPPSTRFYYNYRPLEGGRSPAGLWCAVRCGNSQDSRSRAVESAGGVGFSVGPILSIFLHGLLVLHRSGQVPETGSLYSMVTNHTHHTFHGPGSCNLDLVGLSLLVQKWGPTLPHPVCDAPRVACSVRVNW